jgi:hypothetical protein
MASRRKLPIALFVCAVCCFAAALFAAVEARQVSSTLWAGLTPVRIPISLQHRAGLQAEFQAVWTERHYVALEFPRTTEDPVLDNVLNQAVSTIGSSGSRPTFDFDWQVAEGSVLVGSGSGRRGADATFSGSATRTLEFGGFPARAGRRYAIRISPGPEFEPLLRASPTLKVGVANAAASVGLALNRAVTGPAAYCLGLLGGGLMIVAFLSYKKRQSTA